MDKKSTEIKAAACHSPKPVMHVERRASVKQPYIFHEGNVSCDPYSLQHMAEREAISARQAENQSWVKYWKNRSASMSANKLLNSMRGHSIHYL